MTQSATNPSRTLTLLVLAGLGASVVLVVWNCLLAARLLEPLGAEETNLAEQLSAVATEIETSASSSRSPVADLSAQRKHAADEASDLCRILDNATPLFAQMAVRPGSESAAVIRAIEALDRGCAYRGQFGYPTDFESLRALRNAFSARRAESLAAVEVAAARLHSSGSPKPATRPRLIDAFVAILAGLVCAVAASAALLSFYTNSPENTSPPDSPPASSAANEAGGTMLTHAQTFATELTIIGGYTEMLLASLPQDHPNRQDMEETSLAVARAENMVHHLVMEIAHPSVLEMKEK